MAESADTEGKQKPDEKLNFRVELDNLEGKLNELKIKFEQYFTGVIPFPPDGLHFEVKAKLKFLKKAPFKNSQINYRLKTIEVRYQTFTAYWKRVLREKEEGTYAKDVFKAKLREKMGQDEAKANTVQGAVDKGLQSLFDTYKAALEKQTSQKHDLNFDSFKKSLLERAKTFKEQHGATAKLTFKIIVKDGKVAVQAKAKE